MKLMLKNDTEGRLWLLWCNELRFAYPMVERQVVRKRTDHEDVEDAPPAQLSRGLSRTGEYPSLSTASTSRRVTPDPGRGGVAVSTESQLRKVRERYVLPPQTTVAGKRAGEARRLALVMQASAKTREKLHTTLRSLSATPSLALLEGMSPRARSICADKLELFTTTEPGEVAVKNHQLIVTSWSGKKGSNKTSSRLPINARPPRTHSGRFHRPARVAIDMRSYSALA